MSSQIETKYPQTKTPPLNPFVPAGEPGGENMNNKFILDACCGLRAMWFNKVHPNAIFIDKRERNRGFDDFRPNFCIKPDIIMDFRRLDFPDKSFKLVLMDPPHIIAKEDAFRMVKYYGNLDRDTWKEDIKNGFDECMRVLDDYGILIFKWNETSIKKKDLLNILKCQPLFGHPVGSHVNTHWFCFMKIPKEHESQAVRI